VVDSAEDSDDMRFCKIIALGLLLVVGTAAHSELYKGIGPLDSLADIKARFPKAEFKELHPAWAKITEFLYEVTGLGMSGTIVIKLDDSTVYLTQLRDAADTDEKRKFWQDLIDKPDEAKTVGWVRWIPDAPIPLQRFIAKYGPADVKDFAEEDMQPYRSWKRGIQAFLTDDEKFVTRVDFTYTNTETRNAYKQKYGFVPDFLKNSR